MDSTRQSKIARLIQQDMGDIFLREMRPTLGKSMVTVTRVRVTPDLSIARVYVSLFPIGDLPQRGTTPATPATKANLFETIKELAPDLRRRLGMRESKQLRIIPALEFFHDDSLDYIEHIEELLKQ